jgi:hypothetical protein
MNFLRTQSIQRLADILKLKLNGTLWKTQSNLDIRGGRNISFAQTETKDTTTLTITAGKNGVLGYWGSFWDTTNQTAATTTTSYVITINSSDPENDGVSIMHGTRIVPTTPGNYNISMSVQVTNSSSQAHDATFWFRKNGVDVAFSASKVTVPGTHGGVNGHLIFYVDLAQHYNLGDYTELVWSVDNTAVSLEAIAAGTSPVTPASPSVIVSVVQV